MKSNYTVYTHTFPNGKKYVGITAQPVQRRWRLNGNGYQKKGQEPMYNAILKYGWDNIIHEIVAEGLSLEQANTMEVDLIRSFHSHVSENGYNIDVGGMTRPTVTEETKKKMSEAQKGKVLSEETRKKISQARTGKHYGYVVSEETRKKLSEANKNISEETRQRMSESAKTRVMSEETKKKLSESTKRLWDEGYKPRVLSAETRKKMSEAQIGKTHSEETKQTLSEIGTGRIMSEETRKKMSEAQQRRRLREANT